MSARFEPDRAPSGRGSHIWCFYLQARLSMFENLVVRTRLTPPLPRRYTLRRGADLCTDADEFRRLIDQGDHSQDGLEARTAAYQRALDLYHGEYMQDALYEDWVSEERERLLGLYLRTFEKSDDWVA